MPKLKKPPKNAFTFFMQERKGQLERQGHRFPNGLKDVAGMVHDEWKVSTLNVKLYKEIELVRSYLKV